LAQAKPARPPPAMTTRGFCGEPSGIQGVSAQIRARRGKSPKLALQRLHDPLDRSVEISVTGAQMTGA
jgi:hypothetical protein